jgi:DNA-binding response OmpR family regulator
VKVESSPGVGSSFNIFLPVYPAPEHPKAEKAPILAASPSRILVVEDEPLVSRAVQDALRFSGHQVHSFTNGLEALRHIEATPGAYDLLVIDVNLPGMNGMDVVAKLREKGFPARILMVSGRFTASDLSALTRLKVDHSLTKPFDSASFIGAVNTCLAPD